MPSIPGTLVPPKLASAPASPVSGQIYYDTTLNMLLYYNGTTWLRVSKPPTRQIFTGSGTYTTPAGVVAVFVECVGGGGGGGGAVVGTSGQGAVGGGGGGGAYAASLIANPAASYAYAVGAGGTAGGNPGGTGNDTTFGATLIVAKAGAGGTGMAASGVMPQMMSGGAGGAAASCTGDLKLDGGGGGFGLALATAGGVSGDGGAGAMYGSTTRGQGLTNAANGIAGNLYGSGGSGGIRTASTATQTGGVGAQGVIVVTEYYG